MTRQKISFLLASVLLVLASTATAQEQAYDLREVTESLAAGDIEAAVEQLEQIRQEGREFPATLQSMLGTLYVEIGKPAKALDLLLPLSEQSNDPALLYSTGRALMALDRRTEAIEMLERSVAVNPVSPAARELGFARAREGDIRRAYPPLRAWAESERDDREAIAAAAWMGLQLGRTTEVEELLRNVESADSRLALLRARLQLETGRTTEALDTLASIGPTSEMPVQLSTDVAWLAARGYLESDQAERGRELIARLTPRTTEEHWVSAGLMGVSPNLGREMIMQIDRTSVGMIPIEDREDLSRLMVLAAETLTGADRQRVLRYATTLAPWRGADQEPRIESAFNFDPQRDTDRWLGRAELHLKRSEPALALQIASLEAGISGDIRAGFMQVQAHLGRGDLEAAIELAAELATAAPDNADAVYQRGLVEVLKGDPDDAEASFRRAIEIAPDHVPAMNDLATLLAGQGRIDEAVEVAERIVLIDPNNVRARQILDGND